MGRKSNAQKAVEAAEAAKSAEVSQRNQDGDNSAEAAKDEQATVAATAEPATADELAKNTPKREGVRIVASYKIRTIDGDRINVRYSSDEASVEAALDNLVCDEPEENQGKKWPKNLALLVNVKVVRGQYTFSRALAPHVARAVLQGDEKGVKNVALFKHLMGL